MNSPPPPKPAPKPEDIGANIFGKNNNDIDKGKEHVTLKPAVALDEPMFVHLLGHSDSPAMVDNTKAASAKSGSQGLQA